MPTTLPRSGAPEQYRKTYRTARTRLEQNVGRLAHVRGLAIIVELGPSWAQEIIPTVHTVKLGDGKNKAVVCIDPGSFTSKDAFFSDFVLPQISTAMDKLVSG
jgi:hypothetical protein